MNRMRRKAIICLTSGVSAAWMAVTITIAAEKQSAKPSASAKSLTATGSMGAALFAG